MSNVTSTPLKCRLKSFIEFPMPNPNPKISPSKLAEAGFIRTDQAITTDEVKCCFCDAKYRPSDWDGESPHAVHRILNPKCPYMNTPASPESTELFESEESESPDSYSRQIRNNSREAFRRRLFPDFIRSSSVSTATIASEIKLPMKPKQGDFLMLFESHRILTFSDPCSEMATVYAEDGCIFDINSDKVICVFCNFQQTFQTQEKDQVKNAHREQSSQCPFVNSFDVGNISRCLERQVRDKTRNEFLNGASESNIHNLIKHPEFEDITVRQGTYKNWLKTLDHFFPSSKMSECGFYCTCKFFYSYQYFRP